LVPVVDGLVDPEEELEGDDPWRATILSLICS
jgi:hypothetical protein